MERAKVLEKRGESDALFTIKPQSDGLTIPF
jgi:hypothetical protein